MKSFITAFAFIGITYLFLESFIIIHHEMDESKYVELGNKFHTVCRFPMGEGVLIDSDWVLTTGCVAREISADLKAGLQPKAVIEANEYQLARTVIHPLFNGRNHDIALVQLKTAVRNTSPSKLFTDHNESGKTITLIGFGKTSDEAAGLRDWNQTIHGSTNKVEGADDEWLWTDFDSPASPSGTSMEGTSAHDESGAPAFILQDGKSCVTGLSSHQDAESLKNRFGEIEFYTRVSAYAPWIESVVKNKR